jgi:predicted dienelactone hydrolase
MQQPRRRDLVSFKQMVAPNGAIAGTRLPLIIISHGTGGSFEWHYDTAIALAEAGFVVAAVTHTGDNYRDDRKFARFTDRSRHIARTLDYALGAWPGRDRIDPARIGIFGFSAGGATALVAIGGTPDTTRIAAHCAEHPDEWGCRRRAKRGDVEASAPPPAPLSAFVHDARIKAAVIAAPAIGYTFTPEGLATIAVPIQLWRGDRDEILPHPYHAQSVYDALPVKPDYRVVPNAGHFAFLAPCSEALAKMAPEEVCHDAADFDRVTFHQEFNATVIDFFRAKLPPS